MTGRDRQSHDDQAGTVAMIAIGACALLYFAWAKLPQAFLMLPGALIGTVATFVPGSDGPAGRDAAIKLIASGFVVGIAFVLLAAPLGVDHQLHRFTRAWDRGASLDVALKRPWAIIPLGSAVLLVGIGAPLLWRAK